MCGVGFLQGGDELPSTVVFVGASPEGSFMCFECRFFLYDVYWLVIAYIDVHDA